MKSTHSHINTYPSQSPSVTEEIPIAGTVGEKPVGRMNIACDLTRTSLENALTHVFNIFGVNPDTFYIYAGKDAKVEARKILETVNYQIGGKADPEKVVVLHAYEVEVVPIPGLGPDDWFVSTHGPDARVQSELLMQIISERFA